MTPKITHDLVVPADIDDADLVSGGNIYDRRLAAGLAALGRTVRTRPVAGAWPRPGDEARRELDTVLAGDGPVLIDGLVACGVPEVVVPHTARRPVAVLVHLPLGEEDPLLDAGEGVVLRAAAAVIVTSTWTARRVIARHGVECAHVHVAPPGVDPAPRAPGTDGVHRLLCLGAVTPTKGQDLLVAALAGLADHPWHADLVGPVRRDPAFVAELRARIADHGLDGRLTITGPRTGAALEATLAAADLLVVPSRIETSGMAAAEALARGIPVLAADVGGLPETLAGAGFLIPAEDVGALGAALRRWFAESALRLGLRLSASSRRGTLPGWAATAGHVDRLLRRLA